MKPGTKIVETLTATELTQSAAAWVTERRGLVGRYKPHLHIDVDLSHSVVSFREIRLELEYLGPPDERPPEGELQ